MYFVMSALANKYKNQQLGMERVSSRDMLESESRRSEEWVRQERVRERRQAKVDWY
jgi:hypothetical protein